MSNTTTTTTASPAALARSRARAFFATYAMTCACTPVQIRECGGLRCATCDAPVVPRSTRGR